MSKRKLGWKELPFGDVLEAGTAQNFETGDWRTERPIFYSENCIQCLLCWVYCPDSAFILKESKVVEVDYKFCKGCGICVKECPTKADKRALVMEEEKR